MFRRKRASENKGVREKPFGSQTWLHDVHNDADTAAVEGLHQLLHFQNPSRGVPRIETVGPLRHGIKHKGSYPQL